MRFDLALFVCCCKSFLSGDESPESDYYSLLGLERDASAEDIKKGYKKKSLQMHPDKLAQRGQAVTDELQAEFTRMKEAYEILSDPHKRETYDAIGVRGMKMLDEPFSIDPQELATNFAKSSVVDRSKIFAIFVGVAVTLLILPILVCLHLDGSFGENASWTATFIPLWIWDGFMIFYFTRMILMGPIERPDHIPPEEWADPLPMEKRYMSLARFCLLVIFEFLAALKLDGVFQPSWFVVFLPYYSWELTAVYNKWPVLQMKIVTVGDLESTLGKPSAEFTEEEKELIEKRYSVVPSLESEEFEAAQQLKARASQELVKSAFRVTFSLFLLIQLGASVNLSWWLVFLPVWVLSTLICYGNYQAFAQVQKMAAEKEPTLFGLQQPNEEEVNTSTDYGAVGVDGSATAGVASSPVPNLTEEEREDLKAYVMASGSNLCSKCCSQGFLLVLICMFVAKLQGASFSSFWIISPFLFASGIVLLCLGLAIYGVSEVPENGYPYDAAQFGEQNSPSSPIVPTNMDYEPPSAHDPSPPQSDPEIGPGNNNTSETGSPNVPTVAPEQDQSAASPSPVDLLDDAETGNLSNAIDDSEMQDLD